MEEETLSKGEINEQVKIKEALFMDEPFMLVQKVFEGQ